MKAERLDAQMGEAEGISIRESGATGPRRRYMTPAIRTCPPIPALRAVRPMIGT